MEGNSGNKGLTGEQDGNLTFIHFPRKRNLPLGLVAIVLGK